MRFLCRKRLWIFSLMLVPAAAGLIASKPAAISNRRPAGIPPVGAVEQNNIGVGRMNQFSYAEASKAFEQALSLAPDFNLARINLGIALFYQQDLDRAGTTLQEARLRDENNPYVHYALGLVLKTMGKTGQAAEEFRRVTQIDSRDAESFYNLGVLLVRRQDYPEAESAFRKALELQPDNTSVMYNLGSLLLKTGKIKEGRAVMERFRPLQQRGRKNSNLGVGTQYGEMGRYALAMNYMPRQAGPSDAPAAAEAPFTDVSKAAGLEALDIAGGAAKMLPVSFPVKEWSRKFLAAELLPSLGGNIALADLDVDGDVDAVLTRFDAKEGAWRTLLLDNDGKGRFTDFTSESGVANSGAQVSAAAGDFDNDGLPDLVLIGPGGNRLYHNQGAKRFKDVTASAGLAGGGLPVSATFVDYDHDGDLDLYVCHLADISRAPVGDEAVFPSSLPPEASRMYRNNGDGTFTDCTGILGVGNGDHHGMAVEAVDLDNDRDTDLIVLSTDVPPFWYRNDRDNHFTPLPLNVPGLSAPAQSLAVADFNRDGAMDLFLAPAGAGANALAANGGDGTMTSDDRSEGLLQSLSSGARFGSGAFDCDNDGDLDLYLIGADGKNPGALWRNLGDGRFSYAGRLESTGGRGSAAADFDGDGRADVLYVDPAGNPRLLRNEEKTRYHWIGVRFDGGRSNKPGIGAKVEIRSGYQYQKLEVGGHNGYMSQDSACVWLGLGSASKADTVTVRWPSGILQSEVNVPADRIVTVKELDRKGTSCPLLYTFNGREFDFVTDFLGGCAIGYLEAPGVYSTPDTDEYVRIEGKQLVPKNGKYLLNIDNQLEEIIFFDRAQLLAVDHPSGSEIYPNERLMPGPPYPEYRIYTTRGARPPVAAVNDRGENVLPLISALDRRYPSGFRNLRFKGYAETHSITLDLGDLPGAAKVLLVMDAWVDYADSSANIAASQSGLSLVPPYLQVKDRSGNWKTVIPSMGFPAGLPKPMTVDLTGKFLSSDHHVRIVTSMRIYWDRILVDTSPAEKVRVTRLDPETADLHFRGFPLYYSPDGRKPWIFDYSRIKPTELWETHAGAYTRFGDVRELLLAPDDMYVITRNGDEIALGFDAGAVPPLPAGWVRDFLLYVDGYGKDMDINSLYPEVLGPLPFHAMSRFPYPKTERYPDDEAHRRYMREYNTRIYPGPEEGPMKVITASSPKQPE